MLRRTVIAAAVLLAATGCGSGHTSPAPTPPATSSAEATPTLSVAPMDTLPPPQPSQMAAPPYADAALIASQAVGAYIDKSTADDQAAWWRNMVRWLDPNPNVQGAYSYTDPANVPGTVVTGGASLWNMVSPYVAVASVPTDGGVWMVDLARRDSDGAWQVERLTPPAGVK